MNLSNEDILTLSVYVDSLRNFINTRQNCSIKYNNDNIQGTIELLTIYHNYRKYIGDDNIKLYNIIKLVDILKSKNINTDFYNPWICYYISCGIGEWLDLWKTVNTIYLKYNKEH